MTTAFPSYSTGTVSVADGGTTVTGTGSNWSGVNARPGDILQIGEFQTIISDVTDATTLAIPPWGGGVQSGASYKIWQTSPLRYAGGQAMADVSTLVAALNTTGYFVFVAPTDTVPDPSYGEDGQYALQTSTGKMWVKDSGVWEFVGTFRGFGTAEAWNSVTDYVPFDISTLDGTSYLAIAPSTNQTPPNATYWVVLAAKGDTGATGATGAPGVNAPTYGGTSATSLAIGTGSKAFTTQAGLAYQNGARVRASSASGTSNWMEGLVTYSGTTLTMTSDKTNGSGTKTDWNLNVVGQPGAGDLSSANNLSDVADADTARANIAAAPFDALAYNGIQVNGNCDVSQEAGATSQAIAALVQYVADGWRSELTAGAAGVSVQQVTDAPAGYSHSLKLTVTSAQASPGSTDYNVVAHPIEGYRTARLAFGSANAQPVSIGFWVKIHRTGTYSGYLANSAKNRLYAFTFTQNVADTWEFKTVTIAGDTTGTWATDNTTGLIFGVYLMAGSSFQGTSGSWSASVSAASGTANGVAATSDTFQITGLVVLPGIELPSAERAPFVMRQFDEEHHICQRYYGKSYDYGTKPGSSSIGPGAVRGIAVSTTTINVSVSFKRIMRDTPTITPYSFIGTSGVWSTSGGADTAAASAGAFGTGSIYSLSSTGLTANVAYLGHYVAAARL